METHPSPLDFHSTTLAPVPRVRPSRAEYQRERRALLHYLYLPSAAEKARLHDLAALEGFGHDFNAWLILKVYAALSGNVYPAGYVEGMKGDLERVRGWLESAREDASASAQEVKVLRAQKDTLLFLLNELPGGAQVVSRFLEEQARGAGL
jgi:hypothetical protein